MQQPFAPDCTRSQEQRVALHLRRAAAASLSSFCSPIIVVASDLSTTCAHGSAEPSSLAGLRVWLQWLAEVRLQACMARMVAPALSTTCAMHVAAACSGQHRQAQALDTWAIQGLGFKDPAALLAMGSNVPAASRDIAALGQHVATAASHSTAAAACSADRPGQRGLEATCLGGKHNGLSGGMHRGSALATMARFTPAVVSPRSYTLQSEVSPCS